MSKGLLKDSCLDINDLSIKNIDLVAKINNSTFLGEVLGGDLYGSEIEGTVKTFKDNNNYKLELKGSSKGPLLTILRLSNLTQIFDASEESGEHSTTFYFTSPMSSSFRLLEENADLILGTKIKGGNFKNPNTGLFFSDLYSSVEYDSSHGVKDGFASIKINDTPVKFDIRKGKEEGRYNTQLLSLIHI